MRKTGSRGKRGIPGRCPKCKHVQRIKTDALYPCCSYCQLKSPRRLWFRKN